MNLKLKLKLVLLMPVIMFASCFAAPLALAVNTQSAIQCGVNGAAGDSGCATKPSTTVNDTIVTVINVLSSLAGVLAVIMIIVAGFRYMTSGGDSNKVASAKNALIYAIIGLVIVALAQIIVKFVLNKAT